MAGGGVSATELYDPTTNTFTLGPNFPTVKTGQSATLLTNGKVLITGGSTVGTGPTATETAFLFDPVTNTLTATGSMPTKRTGHAAVRLASGKVLVAGGNERGRAVDRSRAVRPGHGPVVGGGHDADATDQPHRLPASRRSRARDRGRANITTHVTTTSAVLFDPLTRTWAATASLTVSVSNHRATTLPDGRCSSPAGPPGSAPT